jgi:hypothetical protein
MTHARDLGASMDALRTRHRYHTEIIDDMVRHILPVVVDLAEEHENRHIECARQVHRAGVCRQDRRRILHKVRELAERQLAHHILEPSTHSRRERLTSRSRLG